jgi:RNA polymerase sigma-70 factor (ECF subfamily)
MVQSSSLKEILRKIMKNSSSSPYSSDESLMTLVQKGDRDAFNALIHKYQDILLNFFHRMNVYNDTEDLVQETFLRIYRYRLRYTASAKFSTFLFRIARQVHIDRWRKQKNRNTMLKRLLHRKQSEIRTRGAADERIDEAEQALMKLPEAMRIVVILHIYHDLKYADIAGILDIPVGTVKSRMFNALRSLREMLNG